MAKKQVVVSARLEEEDWIYVKAVLQKADTTMTYFISEYITEMAGFFRSIFGDDLDKLTQTRDVYFRRMIRKGFNSIGQVLDEYEDINFNSPPGDRRMQGVALGGAPAPAALNSRIKK